jgi:hypothetical protein
MEHLPLSLIPREILGVIFGFLGNYAIICNSVCKWFPSVGIVFNKPNDRHYKLFFECLKNDYNDCLLEISNDNDILYLFRIEKYDKMLFLIDGGIPYDSERLYEEAIKMSLIMGFRVLLDARIEYDRGRNSPHCNLVDAICVEEDTRLLDELWDYAGNNRKYNHKNILRNVQKYRNSVEISFWISDKTYEISRR